MTHPLAQLFGSSDDENDSKHKLLPEAQIANLREAWAYYQTPKPFVPGEILRCRQGMSIFKQDPTIVLYVRPLYIAVEQDRMIIEDEISRSRWNVVNCIVMRVHDTGTAYFLPFDQNILEHVP